MTAPRTIRFAALGRLLLATVLLAAAVLLAFWTTRPATVEAQTGTRLLRVADVLDTFGANIHIGSDPYNDPVKLAGMLRRLGITHVRQTSPITPTGLAMMQALGQLGPKFDLVVNGGGPVDLPGAMATIKQMAPYLDAVEGVNEAVIFPITYAGLSGVDAAVALQKDLYRAVRTSPTLEGVAVYIFTLGGVDPGAYPSIGDLSAHADFANVHSYPPHGMPPIFVIHAAIDGGRTSAPAKPVVVTETGFYTLPDHDGWGGVPEAVQASYLLCLLLDEAAAGVTRTFLYDLIDDGPDPSRNNREHHFGLYRFDGSAKPSANAIGNMNAILADGRSNERVFQPALLAFKAEGVPYRHTGDALAMQKSDGTSVIALWNEQKLWDPGTRTETPVRHIPVQVSFPQPHPVVLVHDPLVGTAPIAVYRNIQELTVDLTDHPLFVLIPPDKGAKSPPAR